MSESMPTLGAISAPVKQAIMPLDVQCAPSKRSTTKAETARLKESYGIKTHGHDSGGGKMNWIALSMPMAARALSGYSLTEDEKTNLFDIIAGYCRLLDDMNLLAEGFKTEHEAVKRAAEIAVQHGEKEATK